jgi:hypothetical protein
MRVGTVCFATKRGLGYLAKSFYDHGVITDVAVVRHGSIDTNMDWYPNGFQITTRPFLGERLKSMIRDVDCMLFFETPFEWEVIDFARSVGTKTFLMPMYECMPTVLPSRPDFFICPSLLDMEYFPKNSTFIPIPIDQRQFPWRLRTKAEVFVHNGGYLGLQGREGTYNLINAMSLVKSPIKLIVRTQKSIDSECRQLCRQDPRIDYHLGTVVLEDLYKGGDVSIGAQIWNGCSLPLQEAYASGLLVMNTNRFPINTWLPKEPLIPVKSYDKGRIAARFNEVDIARVSSQAIAESIDYWYGQDIREYSHRGREWANSTNWNKLKPRYLEVLNNGI